MRFHARWIVPISGPVIDSGTVEVQSGRITSVGQRNSLSGVDLGDVAVLPGLVNAHTHLEFSGLASPIDTSQPFTHWLRGVISYRRGVNRTAEFLRSGSRESRSSGTTLLGEIATTGWSANEVLTAGLSGVTAFYEFLGLNPDRIPDQLSAARQFLQEAETFNTSAVRGDVPVVAELVRGLSPHAPYSTHPELVRGLVETATEFSAPVAMHLAETIAELEFLAHGGGEFRAFLEQLGVYRASAIPAGSSPLDYLRTLSQATRALVIHGNYLTDQDIDYLVTQPQMTVVYCPRTHAAFGHTPHRWREMLARGIRVAIGTDSRASNPDLDLWREMQFLFGSAQVASDDGSGCDNSAESATLADDILRMGTLAGAEALGCERRFGHITPGADSAMIVVGRGTGRRSAERSTAASSPNQSAFGDDPGALAGELLKPETHVVGLITRDGLETIPPGSEFD